MGNYMINLNCVLVCGFLNGYSESYIEKGPWEVSIPKEFEHLKKEIEEVVNKNIPEGCCGGCL